MIYTGGSSAIAAVMIVWAPAQSKNKTVDQMTLSVSWVWTELRLFPHTSLPSPPLSARVRLSTLRPELELLNLQQMSFSVKYSE